MFQSKQTGKKFRSRNDIRVFLENQGQYDFNPENFDFCIHRRKRNHAPRLKQEATPEKKIKTLLPKTKTLPTSENTLLQTPNTISTPPNISTPVTSTDGGKIYAIYYILIRVYHILMFEICFLHSTLIHQR